MSKLDELLSEMRESGIAEATGRPADWMAELQAAIQHIRTLPRRAKEMEGMLHELQTAGGPGSKGYDRVNKLLGSKHYAAISKLNQKITFCTAELGGIANALPSLVNAVKRDLK